MRFAPFYEASSPTPTCSSAKRRTRHSTALDRHQHAVVDAGFDHHFGHQRADRRLSKTSECLHRFNLHVATPIPIVPVIRRLMCICMRTMVENWENEGPAYSNGPATATLPPATQPPTAGSPSGGPPTSGLCLKPASLDLQRAFFLAITASLCNGNSPFSVQRTPPASTQSPQFDCTR